MFEELRAEERSEVLQACKIIKEIGRANTSMLQRRMRLGYTHAAVLMDFLDEAGVISPPKPDYTRDIFADKLDEALSTPNKG